MSEPAPSSRSRNYPWHAHAQYLLSHPNQWVMVEPSMTGGTIQHIRTGRQRHMAKLLPHLEIRTRNPRTVPGSRTPRFELWIRYRPSEVIDTGPEISNETVASARSRFATGRESMSTLAKDYGVAVSTIADWVRGRTRLDAGGPINQTIRRRHRRDQRPEPDTQPEENDDGND